MAIVVKVMSLPGCSTVVCDAVLGGGSGQGSVAVVVFYGSVAAVAWLRRIPSYIVPQNIEPRRIL